MSRDLTPNMAAQGYSELDLRSRDIFRRIVEGYLESGEPVGSRNISKVLPVSLSAATVRNVMQDLEDIGLIYAPHVSAGRLPTEMGLRLFVDSILEIGDVSAEDRSRIEAQIAAGGSGRSFEDALAEATTLLSGVSRGAGVVVTSKSNKKLRHIEFVRLDPSQALVVLVAMMARWRTAFSPCRPAFRLGADGSHELPQPSPRRPHTSENFVRKSSAIASPCRPRWTRSPRGWSRAALRASPRPAGRRD